VFNTCKMSGTYEWWRGNAQPIVIPTMLCFVGGQGSQYLGTIIEISRFVLAV